jgi:hypothetical protein
MGGTNKGGGTPEQIQESQLADQNALTSLAQQQGANSNTLFNLGLPGLQTSENQAATLASGDPDAIAKLVAPAAQQVQTATAGAKQNILNTAPAGGAKDLAIENADVQQGGQIGALASQGYNNSFNTLAQLGGANVSSSQNAAGIASSGFNSASNIGSTLFSENQEQKGATLGMFGTLGGDAASGIGGGLATAAGGGSGLASLAAGLLAF